MDRRQLLGQLAVAGAATLLPGRVLAAEDADVLIIGAGLSGLNAAMMLAAEGARVVVVEADRRPGGRIRTLDDAPGRPEAGGSEIGPLYARTRRLADDLGLKLVPRGGGIPGMTLHIDGRLVNPRDWATDKANPLSGPLRPVPPFAVEGALLAKAPPLPDAEAWLTPEGATRDGPYDAMLTALGADKAALSFVQPGTDQSLADTSALWKLRGMQIRMQSGKGSVDTVSGGMSRLTDAMAASLGDKVRYGISIKAIRQTPSGVVAEDQNGRRYQAKRALVTVPLPVLRKITLDPLPPAVQSAAWAAVPYSQAASFFYPVTAPFWEQDGLPPSLWSDTLPFRTIFIPGEGGQYLWVFADGPRAAPLQRMADSDLKESVMRQLITARPSLDGRITVGGAWSWTANPRALGTFASRRPGNLAAIQKQLQASHGRIAFAGEHSADLSSGIEGALESGERAAIELLS